MMVVDVGRERRRRGGKNKNKGTQAPYRLSDVLSAVCGKSFLPRPQVTQALWKYIRENDLQVCTVSTALYIFVAT